MTTMSQEPTPESAMNAITRQSRFRTGPFAGTGSESATSAARLQAIHDLVRSGGYHIPAAAIADRMIEQMVLVGRRRSV